MEFILLALIASLLPKPNVSKTYESVTTFNDLVSTKNEIKSYYSALSGQYLKGEELLKELNKILKVNQTKPDYSGGSPTWYNYLLVDRNFEKSNLTSSEISALKSGTKKWWLSKDIYCDVLYSSTDLHYTSNPNSGGTTYISREHVFPKSYGFNNSENMYTSIYAGCDIHNLKMADHGINVQHSNDFYGNAKNNKTPINSAISKVVGGYTGTSGSYNVFEPLDEDKGNVARCLMYMVARYYTYEEGTYGPNPALRLSNTPDVISGTRTPSQTKNSPISYGILNDILGWNTKDPIDNNEIIRNSLIHKFIQNNRNPFIDYPLWADVCFNPDTQYVCDLSQANGVTAASEKATFVQIKDKANIVKKYKANEEIDFSSITATFYTNGTSKEVSHDELSFQIESRSDSSFTPKTIRNKVTLEKGEYTFIAKYVQNETIYQDSFDFDVEGTGLNIDAKTIMIIISIVAVVTFAIVFTAVTGKRIKLRKNKKGKSRKR